MSLPLILGCLWIILGAAVALLPMRQQFAPGFVLLLAAPVLIVWIGAVHGWIWSAAGAFAFVSMFRRPLSVLLRHAMRRGG